MSGETDILQEIVRYLLGVADLSPVFGERVYGDPSLPTDYTPDDGAAVTFTIRGGADDYSTHLLDPSVQFSIFGPDAETRWRAYRLLRNALNTAQTAKIISAWCEAGGQQAEPVREGEWPFVFTAWRFLMHDT